MLQAEYYVLESTNDSCMFDWDQRRSDFGMGERVEYHEPVKMRLNPTARKRPKYLDLHEVPAPVVSKKIVDILAPLDIYGIQLVPADVRNPKDPSAGIQHYWFLHIWNRIHCLDRENSDLNTNRAGTLIYSINKFIFDEKNISVLELKNRLIFNLAEKTSTVLVHQSIKEAIMSVDPSGFRFFKATEWGSNIVFG